MAEIEWGIRAVKITETQLVAACEALLEAMGENGFDVFDPLREGSLDFVGIASSGDIKTSLAIALKTLGISVE